MPGLKANPLPENPTWLRADAAANAIGVDRERNVIRGMVVAQLGPFKSEGRGEFGLDGLRQVVQLARVEPLGLKSRRSHPTLSDDGTARFLGRVRNARMDSVRVRRGGTVQTLQAVRGDLHLDATAMREPVGGGRPLGLYVMDRAESDPDSISSSLVGKFDQVEQLDERGMARRDERGDRLPPLWMPTALHASDVVDTGDAVDGLLSAEQLDALPDALVRRGTELLDSAFVGLSTIVIKSRLQSWLDKYLAHRFAAERERLERLRKLPNPTDAQLREWWQLRKALSAVS